MNTTTTQSVRYRSVEVKKVNKSSVTVVRVSVKTQTPSVQDTTTKKSFSSLAVQEVTNAPSKRK